MASDEHLLFKAKFANTVRHVSTVYNLTGILTAHPHKTAVDLFASKQKKLRTAHGHAEWISRLVARHLKTADDLFDSKPSPRNQSLVAAAVQWAERIMQKIDNVSFKSFLPNDYGLDPLRSATAPGPYCGAALAGKNRLRTAELARRFASALSSRWTCAMEN
jgi:hypothetical protein